jgi:enoyl-CoA hydratase
MLLYSRDHSVADGLNYVATWNAGMLSVEDVMRSIQAQIENTSADYKD